MAEEKWSQVADYEGLYEVSNHGNVRRTNGQLVKQWMNKAKYTNYKRVRLVKNGKAKIFEVHRLVAMAFVSNPLNYPIVNHKDENGENNNADNLEWCTRSYNAKYGSSYEKIVSSAIGRPGHRKVPVDQYSRNGCFINRHDSQSEAARSVNGAVSNIQAASSGRKKTAYGYIWKRIEV